MKLPWEGYCRSCGKLIWWVTTKTGKKMPVDTGLFYLRPNKLGDTVAINYRGEVVKGFRLDGPERDAQYVGISHFATCPHAAKHRRK